MTNKLSIICTPQPFSRTSLCEGGRKSMSIKGQQEGVLGGIGFFCSLIWWWLHQSIHELKFIELYTEKSQFYYMVIFKRILALGVYFSTILGDFSINSIFFQIRKVATQNEITCSGLHTLSGGSQVDPLLAGSKTYSLPLSKKGTKKTTALLNVSMSVPSQNCKALIKNKSYCQREHTHRHEIPWDSTQTDSILSESTEQNMEIHPTYIAQRTKNNSQLCQPPTVVNMCQLSSISSLLV